MEDKKNYGNSQLDIVVVAGQSNAAGHGVGEVTEEYVPDARVLWMTDASNPHYEEDGFHIDFPAEVTISVAEEPIGECGKLGKLGFSFARKYAAHGLLAEGRRVLIIHAAVGGTGFCRNQWGVDGILYRRLCAMTQCALEKNEGNRLAAFLWHQGECDAFENADWQAEKKYTIHREKLGEMLEDFAQRYDCGDLPFITGGFCREWYLKNKLSCDAVLQAIREVTEMRDGAFVETDDLKSNNQQVGNGDDIHFCREALYLLGERMFEAYLQLRNKTI